ncbi:hypothetical protein C8Q74DRAFT_1206278, partial [Fomes fomentarius]
RVYMEIQKQINTSAPINTLPPEILVLVFKDVMVVCRYRWTLPAYLLRRGHPGDFALIRLTHVCTLGRDVAIRCPSLWAHVDGHKLDKLAAILEQSQHLPMSVVLREADVVGRQKVAFQDMLVRSSSCLRRLDLVSQLLSNFMASVLSFHVPNLECLTISSSADFPYGFGYHERQQFPILKETADSLKALAIAPIITWFPTNTFPALTHLHLQAHPDLMFLPLPLGDVLQLLRNSPRLEFLHVTGLDTFVCNETGYKAPSNAIPLPCLRSIVFCDSMCGLTFLVL